MRGHSAHISHEVEVHYRWHALHGRKVRHLYAERKSGREVVVVEAEPGVAIVLAAWMLDATTCATMSLGPPTVDVAGLADLDRLLKALGLRRTCCDEPSSAKEVHHAVVSDCFDQTTPSAQRIAQEDASHSAPPRVVTHVRQQGSLAEARRLGVQLHERCDKQHVMPCHHALAAALRAYLDAAGIAEIQADNGLRCSSRRCAAGIVGLPQLLGNQGSHQP